MRFELQARRSDPNGRPHALPQEEGAALSNRVVDSLPIYTEFRCEQDKLSAA